MGSQWRGTINQEQMVISDVDLELLEEQRINGTVTMVAVSGRLRVKSGERFLVYIAK